MHRLLFLLLLLPLCGCLHTPQEDALILPRPQSRVAQPGEVVHVLPRNHRPIMIGGRSYFEADGIHYVARGGRYIVVPKPR
jgi:hypothetical protein